MLHFLNGGPWERSRDREGGACCMVYGRGEGIEEGKRNGYWGRILNIGRREEVLNSREGRRG